jgi:autotransporter-associated beta strand protein
MIQFGFLSGASRWIGRSGLIRHSVSLMLAGWVFSLFAGQRILAGTIAWDGDTSTAWATGTNWIGDLAPVDDFSTDLAAFVFGSAPSFQPNAGSRSIAGIVIGDGTTAVPTFTISGTSLTIGGSGVTKLAASANTTISSPVVLATGQSWTNNAASTLAFSGSIATDGNLLTVAGSGDTVFSGILSGTAGLQKTGAGKLRLQGNNPFSGAVTVQGGRLELAGNTALADTAAVTLADDATATLRVAAVETIGSLAGGGAAGGFVLMDAALTTGAANTSTSFGGWLDGGSAFIKTGTGTLTLTNTATNDAYNGRVDIFGGTISIAAVESLGKRGTTRELHLSNGSTLETTADLSFNTRVFQLFTADGGGVAGRFDVAAGTTTTLKGNIQGLSGSGGLRKEGTGTLALETGAVQYKNYQGATTVAAGTLRIDAQLRDSPNLTVAAGATLSGSGRIDKAVTTIAGIHAPGSSPGIQQFGVNNTDIGDLTYQAGSQVLWELVTNSSASRGTNYDGIDLVGITSTLDFAGATSLRLSFSGTQPSITPVNWSDFFWNTDQSWQVFDVAGTTTSVGNFTVQVENWIDGNGQPFDTIRPGAAFSLRQTGQNVELVYAVPEPASWSGTMAGAMMLAGGLRFSRRKGKGRKRCQPPNLGKPEEGVSQLISLGDEVGQLMAAMGDDVIEAAGVPPIWVVFQPRPRGPRSFGDLHDPPAPERFETAISSRGGPRCRQTELRAGPRPAAPTRRRGRAGWRCRSPLSSGQRSAGGTGQGRHADDADRRLRCHGSRRAAPVRRGGVHTIAAGARATENSSACRGR